jgi:hypothetical protein
MRSNEAADVSKQKVVDAAERAAQMAGGDERYVKLTQLALKTVGLELARYLEPDENASLCVPADVAHDGRYDPGMVLLSDERAVITWFEGTFRVKVHSRAVGYGDMKEVATSARDRGRLSPYRDGITFMVGGARHEFVLPSKIAEERLTFMVHGILSGAITFGQDAQAG